MKVFKEFTIFAFFAFVDYTSGGGDSPCSLIDNRLEIVEKFLSFEKVINVLNQTAVSVVDEVAVDTSLSIPKLISKTTERLANITSAFSNAGLSFPLDTTASAVASLVTGNYLFASPKEKQLISVDFIVDQSKTLAERVEILFLEELSKMFGASFDELKAVYGDPTLLTSILISCYIDNMQYLKGLKDLALEGIAQRADEARALIQASFH